MPARDADMPRVLIADDQPDVLDALRLLLHPEGMLTESAQSPAAVLSALASREFDVLLMDLNYARDTTSGREGLDLLSQVHALDPSLPVLVMTGWATLDIAIEAMQHGVRDFVQKPWENERVVASVRRQAEERRAARRRAAQEAREQAEARLIQQRLLPRTLPAVEGWDFAAACEEAAWVGGDSYDVIALPSGRLALTIADVAGKGMPAALLASNLQAAVRAAVVEPLEPAAVCARVNEALSASLPPNRFVTFFCGILDPRDGSLCYTNAGHNPPLVGRRDGSFERLETGGIVLGVEPSATYRQKTVTLAAGDWLVMYTDGVVEARNALGDEFGEERLAALGGASNGARCPARPRVDAILAALRDFSGSVREDDQTLLIVRRLSAVPA